MGALSGETSIKKRSPGRPPANEAVAHKEAILDAATSVFLEHGFAAATIAEIVKRSGASKQTLYSLFGSKAVLFEALMHRYLSSSASSSTFTSFNSADSVETILHKVGTRAIHGILSQQRQDLYRLIVEEADQFPELAAEFWRRGPARVSAELTELFERLVREGILEIEDTVAAADQFLGALLWAPLVRFNLRLELPLKTEKEIHRWVRVSVNAFLMAHRPGVRGAGAKTKPHGRRCIA